MKMKYLRYIVISFIVGIMLWEFYNANYINQLECSLYIFILCCFCLIWLLGDSKEKTKWQINHSKKLQNENDEKYETIQNLRLENKSLEKEIIKMMEDHFTSSKENFENSHNYIRSLIDQKGDLRKQIRILEEKIKKLETKDK